MVEAVSTTERSYTRFAKDDPDRVENEALREAFLRSGKSLGEVAVACGWVKTSADTSRVARALGLIRSGGDRKVNRTLPYETAVALVRAMDLDPVDYGV